MEATNSTIFWLRFLGLDDPYLALLGPLLASPASSLTPWTRRNSVSTQSRPIFDPKKLCDLRKIIFGPSTRLNLLRMASKRSKKDLPRNSAYPSFGGVSIRLRGPNLWPCQSVSSYCGGQDCSGISLMPRPHCKVQFQCTAHWTAISRHRSDHRGSV